MVIGVFVSVVRRSDVLPFLQLIPHDCILAQVMAAPTLRDVLHQYLRDPCWASLELSEGERNAEYPGASVIHRTVEYKAQDCDDTDAKKRLALAAGKEFEACCDVANPAITVIKMNGRGLSCHRQCTYGNRVRSGVIPLRDLDAMVGGNLMVDEMQVSVGGMTFPLVQCYHRPLPSTCGKFSVSDAFDVKGKDERCLLDPEGPFSFYWDKSEHGVITLQDEYVYDRSSGDAVPFNHVGTELLFHDPPFYLSKWVPCPHSLSAKIPYPFAKLLANSKNPDIQGYLRREKRPDIRDIVNNLWIAFSSMPAGKCQRVEQLMEVVWNSTHMSDLPLSVRKEIFDVVAGVQCDPDGEDDLRKTLLLMDDNSR